MKESTRQLFKMHRWRIDRALHGYIYYTQIDRYIWFIISVARKQARLLPRSRHLLDYVFNRYHCKVLTEEHAEKLLTLNQDIVVDPERSARVIPFSIAHDIVLSRPQNIVVMDCGCRLAKGIKDEPLDVCLIVGEPGASFCLEHNAQRLHARRVGSEEAIGIMRRERENGCIPTAWFKDSAGERFYAICICHPGSCAALEATHIARTLQVDAPPNIAAPSGYCARVENTLCDGCQACVKACPFRALILDSEDKVAVIFDPCMGCGLCVSTCRQGAFSIEREERKGIPMDIAELVEGSNIYSTPGLR